MLFDVVLERGASVATPFRDPGHLTVNRVLSSGDSLGHLRFTQPLEGQLDIIANVARIVKLHDLSPFS